MNHIINHRDLTDIYRPLNPSFAEYTLFSSANRVFTMIHYILGHKTNSRKFKRTDITTSMFFDYNEIKLEINNGKIFGKSPRFWKLNNTFINNLSPSRIQGKF